jgi:hypothetical protein
MGPGRIQNAGGVRVNAPTHIKPTIKPSGVDTPESAGVCSASGVPAGLWPCACHRTYRGRRQIKLHSRSVARCRACGVTRAESDAA